MDKRKLSYKNIKAWLQGNLRYFLYYTSLKFLIRRHIREQIDARIKSMNQTCYNQGSCIKCGCLTTQLQMANKECEGNCYPVMQNKTNWKLLKDRKLITIGDKFAWQLHNGRFKKYTYGTDMAKYSN